jgi:hypothetical protein
MKKNVSMFDQYILFLENPGLNDACTHTENDMWDHQF